MTDVSPEPLLALVMIVKNEARSIEATIASVKPFVDRYTIVDTGSTDGTQDLVRRAFEGTPGELLEAPFVDFSTTRNVALEAAEGKSVFTLMLSGDETLAGGEVLRAFCERERQGTLGAYHVTVHYGGESHYASSRLARTKNRWRYTGVTHEVLHHPDEHPSLRRVPPEAFVVHDLSHRDPTKQRLRWLEDKRLLTADHARDPGNLRTVFYLAQTHECLGENVDALVFYEKRARAGGWREEAFEAQMRVGRVKEKLALPWPEVLAAYLSAYQMAPHRAEPLHSVAMHYYRAQEWPLAYLFARRAAELPYPKADTLFVDAPLYQGKADDTLAIAAFYAGEYEVGEAAARRALATDPDNARLKDNLSHFLRRKRPPPQPKVEGKRAHLWLVPHVDGSPAHAFDEAIASFRWCLRELGYEVTEGTDVAPGQLFVFGANLLPERAELPDDCIVMNFEQIVAWRPHVPKMLEGHLIWNYEPVVHERFRAAGLRSTLVRFGWTPTLPEAEPPSAEEEVDDVFFAGWANPYRKALLDQLRDHGLRVVHEESLYGVRRDAVMRRAKLVLSMQSWPRSPFMPLRMLPAWSLGKAVLSDAVEGADVFHPGLVGEALPVGTGNGFIAEAVRLVGDRSRRLAIVQAARAWMKARPYLPEVKKALEALEAAGAASRVEVG